MNEIHSVAILGAGAMGAYFAARFHDAAGFDTVLLAEGPRNEKLEKNGFFLNDKPYHLPVLRPEEAEEPFDLLIIAVKHHQFQEAIQNLGKVVGKDTLILSVMNGLESEEIIGSVYGMEKLLYMVAAATVGVRVDNRITISYPGTQMFGELKNETLSPRVQRIQAAFEAAGIPYQTPADMQRTLWWKFMMNVGINQSTAVTGSRYAVLQAGGEAKELMETLMYEVVALAQAAKIDLKPEDVPNATPTLNKLSAEGKTSMLQDVEARRKTEVEIFAGKVIELGERYGVPTPVNRTIYQIIRTLEQNYLKN